MLYIFRSLTCSQPNIIAFRIRRTFLHVNEILPTLTHVILAWMKDKIALPLIYNNKTFCCFFLDIRQLQIHNQFTESIIENIYGVVK